MEKCTFCLQRIAAARIVADIENRPIGADEVRTACQAACPTQAISFGNMAEGGRWSSVSAARCLTRCCRIRTRVRASPTRRASPIPNPALGTHDMSGIPVPIRVRSGGAARQQQPRHDGSRLRPGDAEQTVPLVVDRDRALRRPYRRAAHLNRLAVLAGRWHLGHRLARDVGLRHHQLCLVDRDRQRRHLHLCAVLSDPVRMAELDQPPRRVNDAVRRRLRRHLSNPPSRPAMVVLLAAAVSRDHAHLAAIP